MTDPREEQESASFVQMYHDNEGFLSIFQALDDALMNMNRSIKDLDEAFKALRAKR